MLLLITLLTSPSLTDCLGDGLRAGLPSLSVLPGFCDCVNRLPLLKRLNERLFSGCEQMTGSQQLCNSFAGEIMVTVKASQRFKYVFDQDAKHLYETMGSPVN